VAPSARENELRQKMVRAGVYHPSAMEWYRGAQVVLALLLSVAVLALTAGLLDDAMGSVTLVIAAALAGFRAPSFWLARCRSKRVRELDRTLPNAVDLLIVCIESGLGLDQALRLVARELGGSHPAISREFNLLNGEVSAGKSRAEALRNLAERTATDAIRDLVSSLIQADRFGTSICQTLHTRSEYMRIQARQKAEEKAAKLGIKLIFPIFFCVLPTLFLVTLGPAVFELINQLIPVINAM
jgi:tight adherence protein C